MTSFELFSTLYMEDFSLFGNEDQCVVAWSGGHSVYIDFVGWLDFVEFPIASAALDIKFESQNCPTSTSHRSDSHLLIAMRPAAAAVPFI